jgi:hypothetical protein
LRHGWGVAIQEASQYLVQALSAMLELVTGCGCEGLSAIMWMPAAARVAAPVRTIRKNTSRVNSSDIAFSG